MKTHQQYSDPRHPSDRRPRHHEHNDRDEMEMRSEGGDYFDEVNYRMPNGYANRDYSNANYNFWPQQDEPQFSNDYAPSSNYGYERDEYDRSGFVPHHGQATGYGNDNSVQARDFERWAHQRNNNWRPQNNDQYNDQGFERRYNENRGHQRPHNGHMHEQPQQQQQHSYNGHPGYYSGHSHNSNNHSGHNHGRVDDNQNFGYRGSYRRNHDY